MVTSPTVGRGQIPRPSFFTLPFSFTLDFVFTLTLAYDSFDFDFNSYLSFHYLALIGFKPLLRRYETVLSLDISHQTLTR